MPPASARAGEELEPLLVEFGPARLHPAGDDPATTVTPAVFQGIGPTELAIVLVIVLIIFGPKRLPQLGRQLGSGMREFKDSITGRGDSDEDDVDDDGTGRRRASAALGRPEGEEAPHGEGSEAHRS